VSIAAMVARFWLQVLSTELPLEDSIPTNLWELYHEPADFDVLMACPVCNEATTDPESLETQECRPCVESWLARHGDAGCALVRPNHSPDFTVCIEF
jgi:hypothetical protein